MCPCEGTRAHQNIDMKVTKEGYNRMRDRYQEDEAFNVTSQVGPVAVVPIWVLRKGLTGSELAVYVALRSYADRGRDAFPKTRTIADRAGVHPVTARKAIVRFRELDLVRSEKWHRQDGSVGGNRYHLRDIPADEEREPDTSEVSESAHRTPKNVAGRLQGCSEAATGVVAPRLQQEQTKGTDQGKNYWSPPAETSSLHVETFSATDEKTPATPQRRRRATKPAPPAPPDTQAAIEGIPAPQPSDPTAGNVQALVALYASTVTEAGGVTAKAHLAAIGRNVKLRLGEGIDPERIRHAVIEAARRGHKGIDAFLAAPQQARTRDQRHAQIDRAQAELAARIGPDGDGNTVLDMVFG